MTEVTAGGRPAGSDDHDNSDALDDDRIARLHALADDVDRLHDEAWAGLDHRDLSDALAILDRVRTGIASLDAVVVGAADAAMVWAEHGNASITAYLRTHTLGHTAEASRRAQLAEALPKMPLVAKALRAGDLSPDHARLLATCLHPRFAGQFHEFEAELVGWAAELPWRDFDTLIDRWKDAADDRLPDERDVKDQAAREFHLSRSLNDRGIAKGTLTPIARNIVRTEIDRLCQQLFRDDWADAEQRLGRPPTIFDLARTDAQRRHDALVIMAERSAGADQHTQTPVTLMVHVSYAEAEAIAAEAAGFTVEPFPYDEVLRELADGTHLSRRTVHELAIRANVRRVVFDPDGEILDLGRPRRFFSPAQRLAAAILQPQCACGCGLDARLCDADHDTEVRDGGNTDLRELIFRCRRSHSMKTARRTRRRAACPCACICAHRRE